MGDGGFKAPLEALAAVPQVRPLAAQLVEEALDSSPRRPVPTVVEEWVEDGSRDGGHWELVDG